MHTHFIQFTGTVSALVFATSLSGCDQTDRLLWSAETPIEGPKDVRPCAEFSDRDWIARRSLGSGANLASTLTAEGNLVVASSHYEPVERRSLLVNEITPEGEQLWLTEIREFIQIGVIRQMSDGAFLIGGWVNLREDLTGVWLAKLDRQGELEWEQMISSDHGASIRDIAETGSDEYLVVGQYDNYMTMSGWEGDREYSELWIARFSSDGTLLGSRSVNSERNDFALRAVHDGDGGHFIIGAQGIFGEYQRGAIWILRLDTEGEIEWQETLLDPDTDISAPGVFWSDDRGLTAEWIDGMLHLLTVVRFEDAPWLWSVQLDSEGAVHQQLITPLPYSRWFVRGAIAPDGQVLLVEPDDYYESCSEIHRFTPGDTVDEVITVCDEFDYYFGVEELLPTPTGELFFTGWRATLGDVFSILDGDTIALIREGSEEGDCVIIDSFPEGLAFEETTAQGQLWAERLTNASIDLVALDSEWGTRDSSPECYCPL